MFWTVLATHGEPRDEHKHRPPVRCLLQCKHRAHRYLLSSSSPTQFISKNHCSITTQHHLPPTAPSNLLYKVNYHVPYIVFQKKKKRETPKAKAYVVKKQCRSCLESHNVTLKSENTNIRAHSLPPCSPTTIILRSKIQCRAFQIWEG